MRGVRKTLFNTLEGLDLSFKFDIFLIFIFCCWVCMAIETWESFIKDKLVYDKSIPPNIFIDKISQEISPHLIFNCF